jgi:hypothetical protein
MQHTVPMTDDQIRRLASKYLKHSGLRSTMEALGMTEEDYILSLRSMYPYPTYTSSKGAQ